MRKLDKLTAKIYIPIFTTLILIILSVIAVYTKVDQKDRNNVDSFELGSKQVYQAVCGLDAEQAVIIAKSEATTLDMKISLKSKNSQIRKINESFGKTWVKCDEEIIRLIEQSINISKLSMSTFDLTCGSLMDLWDSDTKHLKPSDEDVNSALLSVDYNLIKINHDVKRVKLDNKSSKITLQNIEDGAICSSIIGVYSKMNVDYAVTSVGNVTGVYGKKEDSPFWKLSVKDKTEGKTDESGIGFVKVESGYMCTLINTSISGENLSHGQNIIIDLRTGYPVSNKISSVTILHSDAVVANSLAYICSVLDIEQSKELLNYYKAEAIVVYEDKSICVTEGIKENFTLINTIYKFV